MDTITPNELRIGNWIKHPNGEIFQSTEYTQLIIMRDGKDFAAIPLTADWLKDFGLTTNGEFWQDGNDFAGEFIDGNFQLVWYELAPCMYVHQLQNLYFALTGDELELKRAVGKV